MTIQPIGSRSMALYITPADLREHGLTPAELTLEQAMELTQTAFSQAGIALDGPIEIEAYPDACGVLVFARVRACQRVWFSFGGLEELLAAARSLPAPWPEGELIWWEERYWLSLPAQEAQAAAHLSEFGREETARPHLEACLAEHGSRLFSGEALETLLSYFPA